MSCLLLSWLLLCCPTSLLLVSSPSPGTVSHIFAAANAPRVNLRVSMHVVSGKRRLDNHVRRLCKRKRGVSVLSIDRPVAKPSREKKAWISCRHSTRKHFLFILPLPISMTEILSFLSFQVHGEQRKQEDDQILTGEHIRRAERPSSCREAP